MKMLNGLPLHNRSLDAFGDSTQSVFALAHDCIQHLIPGTIGDKSISPWCSPRGTRRGCS